MADRPILFSGPMVRAILDGHKTQTRRVLKPVKGLTLGALQDEGEQDGSMVRCARHQVQDPRYAPGDRLWVRESIEGEHTLYDSRFTYKANGDRVRWRNRTDVGWLESYPRPPIPSIHMPRWASRLTLVVTDVRVQRLQEISEDDAVAEGIERMKSGRGFYDATVSKGAVRAGIWHHKATESFQSLWDSLNAARGFGWDRNPWVCAVTFEVHRRNIDQMEVAA